MKKLIQAKQKCIFIGLTNFNTRHDLRKSTVGNAFDKILGIFSAYSFNLIQKKKRYEKEF